MNLDALCKELNPRQIALRAYRSAVGRATRGVVKNLTKADFSRKVNPDDLQRVVDEGGVVEAGFGVVD